MRFENWDTELIRFIRLCDLQMLNKQLSAATLVGVLTRWNYSSWNAVTRYCCSAAWRGLFCHGRKETNLSFSNSQSLRETCVQQLSVKFSLTILQRREAWGDAVENRKFINNPTTTTTMNTSILWGHGYVVMRTCRKYTIWVCQASKYDYACPWHMQYLGCGSDVQRKWLSWLFRTCGWMLLEQINCSHDILFQTTLGNVRWQQGRVISVIGWEPKCANKW